jgi:hypothetical protein
LEAGSTTTGSSFLPSTPPGLLISSMVISAVSLSAVSEMAMVPDSECRMPTLMVSAAGTKPPGEGGLAAHRRRRSGHGLNGGGG